MLRLEFYCSRFHEMKSSMKIEVVDVAGNLPYPQGTRICIDHLNECCNTEIDKRTARTDRQTETRIEVRLVVVSAMYIQ